MSGKDIRDVEEAETQPQEADLELEEEMALAANFTPGTFVEIRRNERVTEGIVLASVLRDRTWRAVCLTTAGEILDALLTSIHFSIPNLISADLAKRCGQEVIAETPQARNARIEALRQLRSVTIQAEQAAQGSRMWDRQNITNLYDVIKNNDPTRWSTITIERATSLLYTEPGYINYYATHKYLMDRPIRYIADSGYIRNQQFRVRPERDIKEIQTVEKWITDYRFSPAEDGPYRTFRRKARNLLAKIGQRQILKTGPMTQTETKYPWDENDQVILSFLLRSLQKHTSNQRDPYRVGRNTIINDITRVEEVNDDFIHQTMILLGVIAPWQDLYALSPQLNPASDFSTKFPMEKEAEEIMRSSSRPTVTNTVLGPLDLQPHDPLDSVRHDFGKLRVFVIDDPTASELDDGVSLERIPGEPDKYWVHVHIADPARILHPGHALSHRARTQNQSMYFPSGYYPMLPPSLMHDPKFGLSLSNSSERTEPNRVLTLSAKLDSEGNILEHKLRAGILRNVRVTTYNDVNRALGIKVPPKIHPFGGSSDEPIGPPLTESDLADLRILMKLADDQVARRLRLGVIVPERTYAQVSFKTKVPDEIQSPYLVGANYRGFPEIDYAVTLSSNDDIGSRNLVSEMMKIGCRVASRVGLDHNIPFIRRCLQPFVWKVDEDFQKALELRTSQGYIPMKDFVKFDMFATSGYYSQSPDSHAQLGLFYGEGYSRATSPLRRYMDLVLHWQLHHILLGPNAPPRPPFTSEDIEKLIVEGSIQDLQIRRLHKANETFYALMYIKKISEDIARGANKSIGNPFARMPAWSLRLPVKDNTNSICCAVSLPELGIDAELQGLPHHYMDLPAGSELTVKLNSIQLGLRRTKMVVELA
ncbi:RNB-domain-containing protein [Pholiota conissans]|uniref:RNB-domain-containing protein n=1 Tax=Pholiota conissans TaxID=109636 RepID=A0A9P5ZCH2_9AGAR|nr:RNB-domain-containing protein [Pholiota conissans]